MIIWQLWLLVGITGSDNGNALYNNYLAADESYVIISLLNFASNTCLPAAYGTAVVCVDSSYGQSKMGLSHHFII